MTTTLYGTNLDANMVIAVKTGDTLSGVVRVRSELFNDEEQFYRVKGFDLEKTIHNGRVARYDWEKNRVNFQLVKGIQVLGADTDDEDSFSYEVSGLGMYSSKIILKKNQPLLLDGNIYSIEKLEKTGKRSGYVELSVFDVSCEVVHTYVVKHYDVTQGKTVVDSLCESYVDYLKTKMGVFG